MNIDDEMTDIESQPDLSSKLQEIEQFEWIHAHLATSGQPTVEQLAEIKAHGYTTIINLALTDASNHLSNEDRICLELGLDYIQVPLLWECPSSSGALFVIDLIDHLVQEQKVWVHCAKNMRVSSLIFLYRQFYMGMDLAEADALLENVWQPNETWTGLIHAVRLQLQARQSTKELAELS